jgi:hypothetical protein
LKTDYIAICHFADTRAEVSEMAFFRAGKRTCQAKIENIIGGLIRNNINKKA